MIEQKALIKIKRFKKTLRHRLYNITTSLLKVIKDIVLNSSVAFVVSDVRPLSAVEGDGLIQFANAMIKVGATHGIVDAKAILPSRFTIKEE